MDFEDIGNRLANLTMYDVKQFYTAAKNYALNVSEIEAKVNEATNDDAWGASSTTMQEIAQATNNFQDFNEIMPAIYRNFMEREAREWRQIYKALQLLEYIIKHGSERVVDDARSHLGTIKILRNFHYIDDAGKDQGINVRNRAKEIAELLSDVERIRLERRKARQNKSKYQGAGNSDFVPGSGTGRYGGFGSDSFYSGGGGGGSGAYGGGSSSAARGSGDFGRSSTQRDSFEAYDAGDDDYAGSSAARPSGRSGRSAGRSGAAPAPVKKEEKVADLFSFDDDEPAQAPVNTASTVNPTNPSNDGFDDFDDFQAAPSAPAPVKQTKPATSGANVFDFLGDDAGSSAPIAAPKANAAFTNSSAAAAPLQPQRTISSSSVSTTSKPAGNGSSTGKTNASINFDDLWATSSGKTNLGGNSTGAGKGKMTMAEMAAQKSQSAVWGNTSNTNNAGKAKDPFDFLS